MPDILRWGDFDVDSERWLARLDRRLKTREYTPEAVRVLEVPKTRLLTRPAALLQPRERVVFQALVNRLGPRIDAALPATVYSARLTPGRTDRWLRDQRKDWVRFEKATKDLYRSGRFPSLLRTDVASYFENIDISILGDELVALPGVDAVDVEALREFLANQERRSSFWGLPQGPLASSVLGNFYLLPVDRLLARMDVRVVRFQDDYRVFGGSPSQLRQALAETSRLLRDRRLTVAPGKTDIVSGDEIENTLEDDQKAAIEYAGATEGWSGSAGDGVRRLFYASTANEVRERDFRFSLYRLYLADDSVAVPWVLNHLPELGFAVDIVAVYLGKFSARFPEIESKVVAFADSPIAGNVPYVELQLLRLLARFPALSDDGYRYAWRALADRNRDSLVREHAARCVGEHLRPGDLANLRREFVDEDSPRIQRAILVSVASSGESVDRWLNGALVTHPRLRATKTYLEQVSPLPPP